MEWQGWEAVLFWVSVAAAGAGGIDPVLMPGPEIRAPEGGSHWLADFNSSSRIAASRDGEEAQRGVAMPEIPASPRNNPVMRQ